MTELYIYRASSLGGCDKALIAARMGYTPMETVYSAKPGKLSMQTIFDEGDLHEEAVVAKYKEAGNTITLQQHEINIPILPGVIIQGHLDGVIQNVLEPKLNAHLGRVLEIKSMGDQPFKEFKKKGLQTPGLIQKYKWQISAYMIAMERPALLIAKSRNTGEIIEVYIEEPFYTLSQIRTRILLIEASARRGDLPAVCANPQYPCPFYYLHEDEPLNFSDNPVIDSFVKAYSDGKAMEERGKKQAASARAKLLTISNGESVETPTSKVTFFQKNNNKQLDTEALAKDGIDLEPYYKPQTKRTEMRITDKTKADKDGKQGGLFDGLG